MKYAKYVECIVFGIFLIVPLISFAASFPKGTPLFYQNGSIVKSVVCGDTYSFDVAGYSNQNVWIEIKKDGVTVFDGLFFVPMQPYTSVCNSEINDAGTYEIAFYTTINNNKGNTIASSIFTILPKNTADLSVFRYLVPGILSVKLSASDTKADILFYFLRKYVADMDQLVFVPTKSWLQSQKLTSLDNQGGPLRALVDGIMELPSQFSYAVNPTSRFFGLAYISSLGEFNKDKDYATGSLIHEIGHSWGVNVASKDSFGRADPLGINSDVHWGYFTDNFNSVMAAGPSRLIDNKNGTFKTEWKQKKQEMVFNDFDLYNMGLLTPENVRPTFVISRFGASQADLKKEILATSPNGGIVRATKNKDVSINDVIAIQGRRNPSFGFTKNNLTRDLRVSFIIIQGPDGTEQELNDVLSNVKDVTNIFPSEWRRATNNRSSASIFDPVIKPNPIISSFAASLSENKPVEILENIFKNQLHEHILDVSTPIIVTQPTTGFSQSSNIDQLEQQMVSLLKSLERANGQILCQVPSISLIRGQENGEVTKLQRFLSQFTSIYPEQSLIGYFGPATERAVRRFQNIFGFSAENGVVGEATRSKMQFLCSG